MGKMKSLLFAVVILAVMIVMALRGCPRRYHGRRSRYHRQGAAVHRPTLRCQRVLPTVRTRIEES
ncbi:MAG: hypothetical protein P8Z71_11960 [Candidatus Sulfobium sp.]